MNFNNKIMQFNFKKYITEKYLTEKIQSDIIINKLMNDKGEMFKFYQNPNSPAYQKFFKIQDELHKIIKDIFMNIPRKSYKNENNKIVYINDEFLMDENVLKHMHEKYMKLINDFIKALNNMFIKPDPYLLTAIISDFNSRDVDLFNITDESFETYYYSDLKKNKTIQQKIYDEINNKVAFFISNDKIEAVSKDGIILLLPFDNEYLISKDHIFSNLSVSPYDYIRDKIKRENILDNSIFIELSNKEFLEFPLIENSIKLDGTYDDKIFEFINNKLNINARFSHLYPLSDKKTKVGKINSKASTLQKLTNWGNSLDDQIIIYTPSKIYRDNEHQSTINQGETPMTYHINNYTGYNEIKHQNLINRRYKQRKDYQDIYKQTYKWVKDILGKYKPYAGGKQNEIWSYGKKLTDANYSILYRDDNSNNKIVNDNIARYKVLLNQARSLKEVNIYKEQLKTILGIINTSVINSQNFIQKIKTTYKENKDKFKSLMLLYSVFNKTLSTIIAKYNNIQEKIIDFNNTYNIKNIFQAKNSYDTNADLQYRITTKMADIKNQVYHLNNFMPQLTNINDKINKILEDE